MLAYAGVCWRMLAYASVCWRMLANAHVCCMLTYAEVAERVRAGEREFMSGFEEEEERVTVVLVGSGAIARACCYSLVRP